MNYYPNYTGQYYMPQQNRYPQPPPMENYNQFMQQNQPRGLQGKSVDNIDVVKAMDIPLDGSISYFPIADGSAIVSKQLMQDGTSKTIIYKPATHEQEKSIKYVTSEELQENIKKMDNSGEIKFIKKQLSELKMDIDELKGKEG